MTVFDHPYRIRDRFSALVHASARADTVEHARHQSFITSHLIGGGLAALAYPIYLSYAGGPTILSTVAFAWLVSPVAIALLLSSTGRLALCHLISAVNLAGLVTFVAGLTGGLASFVLPWMMIVPVEAALSNNRRVTFAAGAAAALGMIGLALASHQGVLPTPRLPDIEPMLLAALGGLSALLYACGVAVSVQLVHDQSSEQTRNSERRYRLLAENSTDLITRHDVNGDVIYASLAGEKIMNAAPEEIAGAGFIERVHPADRKTVRDAFRQSASEGVTLSIEYRLHGIAIGTSADRWAETRVQPVGLKTADGTADAGLGSVVAVTRDVTAHKAQETALLQARDAAENASQAKTQFLATMSHELRTPLNAIIGFADILKRELFGEIGEERYREYSSLIHESGEHLLSVVNEILDMSKIEAGKYSLVTEPFDIGLLVKSCRDLMGHAASEKSITLVSDIASELPELTADRRACKQMLLNLLSNAVKFTEPGGEINIGVTMADGMMALRVADNGIGIAPDDLASLGDPFVQVETSYSRKFEGAGLGLCVVKGLARLHGGTLDIASEPGVGTVVTISLPCEQTLPEPHGGAQERFAPVAVPALVGL